MANKKQRRARQGKHSLQRARERYGIEFGKHKRRAVVNAIQDGKGRFVRRGRRKGFSVWDVEVEGETIRVVYNRKLKVITTVLPMSLNMNIQDNA